MKCLVINGSPNQDGTTALALNEIINELEKNDIKVNLVSLANLEISGCISCGYCKKNKKCYKDDIVNVVASELDSYDCLVVGTPVYYAGMNGSLKSFLDRLFHITGGMPYKPGCAVAVARRAGTIEAIDQINKYFTISNMLVVSSQYWNLCYGASKDSAQNDLEGLQTMRILGKNLAWITKSLEVAKNHGINHPEIEDHIRTNCVK